MNDKRSRSLTIYGAKLLDKCVKQICQVEYFAIRKIRSLKTVFIIICHILSLFKTKIHCVLVHSPAQ